MKFNKKYIMIAVCTLVLYLVAYIGLRVTHEIVHMENKAEESSHSVKAEQLPWDDLFEDLSEVYAAKRHLYNILFFPMRKIEEVYWNIRT